MALNKVLLIGNVGKDPEVRHLEGGASVATITLATSERFKDRNGEQKEITEWHTIVAWRQLADLADKFIKKGTQLYVEGRIRTRSWDDQNGNKRYTTEILADSIQLLGKKSDSGIPSSGAYSQEQDKSSYRQPVQGTEAPVSQPDAGIDLNDDGSDDLPF